MQFHDYEIDIAIAKLPPIFIDGKEKKKNVAKCTLAAANTDLQLKIHILL